MNIRRVFKSAREKVVLAAAGFSFHRWTRAIGRTVCLYFALLFPVSAAADAELELNPLIPLREQMKQLSRDCAHSPNNKNCEIMREKLREQMVTLRVICRKDPEDERCGAIMREEESKGWRIEQYCLENPHSKKCVRRRERERRRAKLLRKFCTANPDEKRCFPRQTRTGSGFGTLHAYCDVHPDTPKCIALAEKNDRAKPKPEPITNRF